MADYIIKVSTEEVRSKAQQINTQRGAMEDIMNALQVNITSLEDYFKGDAGRAYTEQYQNLAKNIRGGLNDLQTQVNNLVDYASHIDQVEEQQRGKATSLDSSTIFTKNS